MNLAQATQTCDYPSLGSHQSHNRIRAGHISTVYISTNDNGRPNTGWLCRLTVNPGLCRVLVPFHVSYFGAYWTLLSVSDKLLPGLDSSTLPRKIR